MGPPTGSFKTQHQVVALFTIFPKHLSLKIASREAYAKFSAE